MVGEGKPRKPYERSVSDMTVLNSVHVRRARGRMTMMGRKRGHTDQIGEKRQQMRARPKLSRDGTEGW